MLFCPYLVSSETTDNIAIIIMTDISIIVTLYSRCFPRGIETTITQTFACFVLVVYLIHSLLHLAANVLFLLIIQLSLGITGNLLLKSLFLWFFTLGLSLPLITSLPSHWVWSRVKSINLRCGICLYRPLLGLSLLRCRFGLWCSLRLLRLLLRLLCLINQTVKSCLVFTNTLISFT